MRMHNFNDVGKRLRLSGLEVCKLTHDVWRHFWNTEYEEYLDGLK